MFKCSSAQGPLVMSTFQTLPVPAPPQPTHSKDLSVLSQGGRPPLRPLERVVLTESPSSNKALDLRYLVVFPPNAPQYSVALRKYFWTMSHTGSFSSLGAQLSME